MCRAYFLQPHAIRQTGKLTVYARYTRRGGLDINPYRSNFDATATKFKIGKTIANPFKKRTALLNILLKVRFIFNVFFTFR